MFGLVSLSTIGLVALYVMGFVQIYKGAINAGKSHTAAAGLAVVWPVALWKVMNDLWSAPPPSEE